MPPTTTTVAPRAATTQRLSIAHEDDAFICLRSGSSQQTQTDNWAARLAEPLATMADVAVVGAKRLYDASTIASMGANVMHPKGFHEVARGFPEETHRFAEEVDAITGGVVAIDRAALDACGLETPETPFDLVRTCLSLRRAGHRVVCSPSVSVVDPAKFTITHAQRDEFEHEFGFDLLAADLDGVKTRHAGTGLLWNARFFGGEPVRYAKYRTRPMLHWKSFAEVQTYRSRAEAIINFLAGEFRPGHVLDVGCGDGLFSYLLASKGFDVTGLDIEPEAIEQANAAIASQPALESVLAFMHATPGDLPFEAASLDDVMLLDVIEHLPNPSGMLRALHSRLKPNGRIAVVTPEAQYGRWSDPTYHVCEYLHDELAEQLRACGFEIVKTGRIGEPYRDLIVVAEKR